VLRYGLVLFSCSSARSNSTGFEAPESSRSCATATALLLYALTSVRGASDVIGVIELLFAALIAARRFSPRAAAAGSIGAVAVFVGDADLLVSTPGFGSWCRASRGGPERDRRLSREGCLPPRRRRLGGAKRFAQFTGEGHSDSGVVGEAFRPTRR